MTKFLDIQQLCSLVEDLIVYQDRRRRILHEEGWIGYVEYDGWQCDYHPYCDKLRYPDITDLSYWRSFFDYAFFIEFVDLKVNKNLK